MYSIMCIYLLSLYLIVGIQRWINEISGPGLIYFLGALILQKKKLFL